MKVKVTLKETNLAERNIVKKFDHAQVEYRGGFCLICYDSVLFSTLYQHVAYPMSEIERVDVEDD